MRETLERFALSKNQDPHNPEFWYSLNPVELQALKVIFVYFSSFYSFEFWIYENLNYSQKRFN